MKVLLVDDHSLLLQGLKKLLEVNDIQVVGLAKNGLEAIELTQTLKPDVVLMDIRMPVCDGLTATRLIKAENPEAKIVMLTTSTEDQDLFDAVKSGACGYLIKSMDADDLVESLNQALHGIPPFSPGLATKLLEEFARVNQPSVTTTSPKQLVPEAAVNQNRLTESQIKVLKLIAEGLSYKEAGARLGLSSRTIQFHMTEIMQRLHLQNRAQVQYYAANLKLSDDQTTD